MCAASFLPNLESVILPARACVCVGVIDHSEHFPFWTFFFFWQVFDIFLRRLVGWEVDPARPTQDSTAQKYAYKHLSLEVDFNGQFQDSISHDPRLRPRGHCDRLTR
jgi:hypothetical protein